MRRIDLEHDVRPISDVRKNAAEVIEHVRTTKRPVLITQHGRGAAVLLDVAEYERLLEEDQIRRSVAAGIDDANAGRVRPHSEAMADLRTLLDD